MIRRLFYAIFFVLGGFLFAIPKWILMGTRGSRERKRILKQQREILARTDGAPAATVAVAEAPHPGSQRLSVDGAVRDARKRRRELTKAGVTWSGVR